MQLTGRRANAGAPRAGRPARPSGHVSLLGSELAAGDGWSFYTEALGSRLPTGGRSDCRPLIIAWGQVRVSAGGAIASNEGRPRQASAR